MPRSGISWKTSSGCASACGKLEAHFGQATEDIKQIVVSTDKLERRGSRIREVEFEGDLDDQSEMVLPAPVGARRVVAAE